MPLGAPILLTAILEWRQVTVVTLPPSPELFLLQTTVSTPRWELVSHLLLPVRL